MQSQAPTLVIVGGNAAGMSAARKARRNDPNLKIIVLEKSSVVSYGACGIPYFIGGEISEVGKLVALPVEAFLKENIDVRLEHEVVEINPRQRTVYFRQKAGEQVEKLTYDQLILSLGARPVVPAMEGVDLPGVFTVRTLADASRLKEELQSGRHKKAAIIGGGYIGLEMAEALRRLGVEVSIVELKSHILPTFDEDMAALVNEELSSKGCRVYSDVAAKRILGTHAVTGVELESGETVEASLVILSIGVRPNSSLAQKAGIELGNSGAIKVDARQRTSSFRIFAAGDCAEVKNAVTNKYEYMPLGNIANKQGRVAGDNASGGHSTMPAVVGNTIVKVFDLEVGKAGLSLEQAERFVRDVKTVKIKGHSRAGYMPATQPIHVKLIFSAGNGRLLGAQLVGKEGVDKRLQVLAEAIQLKLSVKELAGLDLSYAPPYSPVWDPVLVAANQAVKLVR